MTGVVSALKPNAMAPMLGKPEIGAPARSAEKQQFELPLSKFSGPSGFARLLAGGVAPFPACASAQALK
jgi:hypothetical protein